MSFQLSVGYEYTFGVVSGLYSKFLPTKDLEGYSMAVNVEEVLASLEKTDYGLEFEKMPSKFTDATIDSALRINFLRVYNEILNSMPFSDQDSLNDVVYGLTDLKNLKTILRALHTSIDPSKIELMLNPGLIDMNELLVLASVDEFTSKINELYGIDLTDSLAEYSKSNSIHELEMALDHAFITKSLDSKVFSGYVRLRIDVLNLVNLFRCRTSNIDYSNHILEGGQHLSKSQLTDLSSLNINEILIALNSTVYGPVLNKNVNPGQINLLAIEDTLENYINDQIKVNSMMNPLTVWPVLDFVRLKQKEVRNLRVILLLKFHNVSSERIKGLIA